MANLGVEGAFAFLIPVIFDGISSKLAPSIFSPNVIAMLQREDTTFQKACNGKRIERTAQLD
jgi:hypothetical protein